MKYDSIIFDLDGTLWNTLSSCTDGWNNGLKSLGIPKSITTNDLKSVVGNPWNICAEMLFPDLIIKHTNLFKILDSFEQKAIKSNGGIFYDGMTECMRILSNHYNLFIISNCQKWYLMEFFKQSKMDKYLQDYNCYGISQIPKSEMINDMFKKHSLQNPVYIGDTAGDQKAAELAKIDFIHAAWGYGKVEKKCLSFDSFTELIDYFVYPNNNLTETLRKFKTSAKFAINTLD